MHLAMAASTGSAGWAAAPALTAGWDVAAGASWANPWRGSNVHPSPALAAKRRDLQGCGRKNENMSNLREGSGGAVGSA